MALSREERRRLGLGVYDDTRHPANTKSESPPESVHEDEPPTPLPTPPLSGRALWRASLSKKP